MRSTNILSLLPKVLRILPLAALGFALASPNASAEPATPSPQLREQVRAPFLWQVDGSHRPSYLFGTIHAGIDAKELPSVVANSLTESNAFVMEAVPTMAMMTNANASGVPPMDFTLAMGAKHQNKPVLGLESLQFQFDLMKKIGSADDVTAMLAEDLQEITELTDAYRSGDLSEIESQTRTDDASLREMLFTRRNHRWVDALDRGLRRGGLFVAVGVGHYPGDDGLIHLLNERGLTPKRIA